MIRLNILTTIGILAMLVMLIFLYWTFDITGVVIFTGITALLIKAGW